MEMAVPIGPMDMERKKNAIFKHQSQKDSAMFPGHDEREFWQRAEHRNKGEHRPGRIAVIKHAEQGQKPAASE